jgi:hypothetical protein
MAGYKEQQDKDVEDAIKKYNREASKGEKEGYVTIKSAADRMIQRKNVLDRLDEDLKDAGRSKHDKLIWGK